VCSIFAIARRIKAKHKALSCLSVIVVLPISILISGCAGGSVEQREEVEIMSLEEAVGQMFVVGMSGTEPNYYINKMIRKRNIGGVILFGANMESKKQTQDLVSELQKLALNTKPSTALIIAVDQEGGRVAHAPWVTHQPPASTVGRNGDPTKARHIAEEIGKQLRTAGVNTNLAPVVDTGFGAAIGDRAFGTDPQLVSEMGGASVEGYVASGVVSAAKHFPNHGPAEVDSHAGLPEVKHSMAKVVTYDLPPFEAAVESGVPMVMVGHLLYPSIDANRPASLSREAFELLREETGFEGVVITDDLSMAAAVQGGSAAQAAVQAAKAGADMLIVSGQPQQQANAYAAVVKAVKSGEISRKKINDSVRRILQMKQEYDMQPLVEIQRP
jgi:beta-N-acetylhexosaminidase